MYACAGADYSMQQDGPASTRHSSSTVGTRIYRIRIQTALPSKSIFALVGTRLTVVPAQQLGRRRHCGRSGGCISYASRRPCRREAGYAQCGCMVCLCCIDQLSVGAAAAFKLCSLLMCTLQRYCTDYSPAAISATRPYQKKHGSTGSTYVSVSKS